MVDHAVKLEHGVSQHVGNDCHVRRTDQLVGHQHPAHAMRISGLRLDCRGEGHAPCARVQLPAKQRGHHAGFAVRCQLCTAVADKLLHPANIVLQRVIMNHQCGQADITDQAVTRLRSTLVHYGGAHR